MLMTIQVLVIKEDQDSSIKRVEKEDFISKLTAGYVGSVYCLV